MSTCIIGLARGLVLSGGDAMETKRLSCLSELIRRVGCYVIVIDDMICRLVLAVSSWIVLHKSSVPLMKGSYPSASASRPRDPTHLASLRDYLYIPPIHSTD